MLKYQHIHLPTVLKLYDFKVCITLPSAEHNRKYNCDSTTTDQSNQLVNKTRNTNILPEKATFYLALKSHYFFHCVVTGLGERRYTFTLVCLYDDLKARHWVDK